MTFLLLDDINGEFKMSIMLFSKVQFIDRDKNVVSYESTRQKKEL